MHRPNGPRPQIKKPKVLYNDGNDTLKSAASSFVDDADIGFDHEEDEISTGNGLRDTGSGSFDGSANSYADVMALIAREPPSPLAVSSRGSSDPGITSTPPSGENLYQPRSTPIRVPVRSNGLQSPALKARNSKVKSKSAKMNLNSPYERTMKSISNFVSSYGSPGYDDGESGYGSGYSGMDYGHDSYDDSDAWQDVYGVPGVDYPAYSSPPVTSFTCASQMYPGYYVDVESNCQVNFATQFQPTNSYLFRPFISASQMEDRTPSCAPTQHCSTSNTLSVTGTTTSTARNRKRITV